MDDDLEPVVVAMVAAAIDQVWPRPTADRADQSHLIWRFSGRWWHRPLPVRRERPWTG